ncbi:hypothetical protein QTP86_034655 [Hemibagrus guttatus]|nr:hypothetical protein QTP86_034655 [Hemibagrus guttatus]
MTFGLTNAPAVFQALINGVFQDLLGKWVIAYIDVYSASPEEHVLHVREVLSRLQQHHLYVKLEKCEFHRSTVTFLGYVVSRRGVEMGVVKVRVVTDWPAPTTVRELQRFLGFANFYRHFIHNYSLVAGPLTSLLRGKPKRLAWTDQARAAFQQLKDCFTTAPILRHPDPDLPFVVEVDASSSGLGAVLSQHHGEPGKLHPCAFYSRKLTTAEANYDVGNIELLVIKEALEEWHHWLEGARYPFQVLTDHRNLEYLRGAKRLNPRQARWALFFTWFQFMVTYCPGSKNGKADVLSRKFERADEPVLTEPILPPTAILAPVRWNLVEEIQRTHAEEPPTAGCPPTKVFVPSQFCTQWPSLALDVESHVQACPSCTQARTSHQLPEGLLEPLLIPQRPWSHLSVDCLTDLPDSGGYTVVLVVVDRFSKECKLIPLKGLPSAMQTAEALFVHVFRNFGLPEDIVSDWGPQFTSQVNPVAYRLRLPAAYRICPTFHVSLLKPAHLLAGEFPDGREPPLPLDVEGSPAYRGNTIIMVIVDRFSKAARFVPLPKLPTAKETAELIIIHVFRVFGIPQDIVSDRGPQFSSHFWRAFCQSLGASVSLSSGFHPESNGQTERLNQDLETTLSCMAANNPSSWSSFVMWAEYAHNTLRSSATGMSPFECQFGYTPSLFPEQEVEAAVPSAQQFVKRCRQTWKRARLKLLKASQQYQHQANRRRRSAPTLRPGQRVWLSTKNIPLQMESHKLSQRFIRPFKISRKVNPVTYRLYLPKSLKINPTFHVSLLKPVLSSPFLAKGNPPPPRIIGGQPAYTVHRVLDVRQVRGSRQYLVDWEGYGPEERSWVPAKDILDPKLIQEFHARKPSHPGRNVRSRS